MLLIRLAHAAFDIRFCASALITYSLISQKPFLMSLKEFQDVISQ